MQYTKRAYLYIRWSSDIQSQGDSRRRQIELGKEFSIRKGLTLEDCDIFCDDGVSAYRGDNLLSGNLSILLERIENGEISSGSYLLVESWDRISRQNPFVTLTEVLPRIVRKGITVVTLNDFLEYRHPLDMPAILMSAMQMHRAHEESRIKSERVAAAWSNKRANLGERNLTRICPAWLSPSSDGRGFVVEPNKADIVRHIFQLAAGGLGTLAIARQLNNERIPALGKGGSWAKSSVRKYLADRSVLGEFQPHRKVSGLRTPIGQIVKEYFPPIVPAGLFNAVQTSVRRRRTKGVGRKGKTYSNLFAGVAVCAECGANMHYRDRGLAHGGARLVCSEADKGACSMKAGWPYPDFEASFLAFVTSIDLDALIKGGTGSRLQRLKEEIDGLVSERIVIRRQQEATLQLLDQHAGQGADVQVLHDSLLEKGKKLAQISTRLSELNAERSDLQNSRRAAKRLTSFPSDLEDSALYKIRAGVAEQIRGTVDSIHVLTRSKPNLRARLQSDAADRSFLALRPAEFKELSQGPYPLQTAPKLLVRLRGGTNLVIFPNPDEPGDCVVEEMLDPELMRSRFFQWTKPLLGREKAPGAGCTIPVG